MDRCPICNKDRDLVGMRHLCSPVPVVTQPIRQKRADRKRSQVVAGECPTCAARRAAHAARMQRYRAKLDKSR